MLIVTNHFKTKNKTRPEIKYPCLRPASCRQQVVAFRENASFSPSRSGKLRDGGDKGMPKSWKVTVPTAILTQWVVCLIKISPITLTFMMIPLLLEQISAHLKELSNHNYINLSFYNWDYKPLKTSFIGTLTFQPVLFAVNKVFLTPSDPFCAKRAL